MEIVILPLMIAAAVGMLAWWGIIMLSAFTGGPGARFPSV